MFNRMATKIQRAYRLFWWKRFIENLSIDRRYTKNHYKPSETRLLVQYKTLIILQTDMFAVIVKFLEVVKGVMMNQKNNAQMQLR